jgi:hypothetical protein
MKLDVGALPKLHWVYASLFQHIARFRPEMQAEAERLARMVDELDCEAFDDVVRQSVAQIHGAFAMARTLMREAESGDRVIASMKLCTAYRLTQLQANYCHVLVDGVIMEGVFEDWSEQRLQQISDVGGIPLLDLLQTIIDPMTEYHYVPIDAARLEEARRASLALQERLRAADRPDLADYLKRFIPFYSGIKRWQVDFKEAHREEFMTVIDPLTDRLVETVRALGLPLHEKEIESNWSLLEVIEAKILPFLSLLQANWKADGGEPWNTVRSS